MHRGLVDAQSVGEAFEGMLIEGLAVIADEHDDRRIGQAVPLDDVSDVADDLVLVADSLPISFER